MKKEKNRQKDIEEAKKRFLEKKISEEQFLIFIKKNITEDIFDSFDLLGDKSLKIILDEISTLNTSDIFINKLLKSLKNKNTIFRIIKIIFESDFIHIKNCDIFYKNFSNFVFGINEEKKLILDYITFSGFALLTKNEVVKLLFTRTLPENAILLREKIFSYIKNVFANLLNAFLESKDILFINSEKNRVISWDIWLYTETERDIEEYFYFLENQTEFDEFDIFSKMNKISNKTFKKLDENFENFSKNLTLFSEIIYDDSNDVENCFDKFNLFEKNVLKEVLYNISENYKKKGLISESLYDKILGLLIDEDFKKKENIESSDDDGVFISPLNDTSDIYSENIKPPQIIENDTQKDLKEAKNDSLPDKKEMKPSNNDEILKIAIEIVKELENSVTPEDLLKEKSKITEIVKEVLSERKKISEEEKIRAVIDQAINEVLRENDFEDL
ncbi:MAG TPA: hypothetical protein PLO89_04590 [Spirochaetota bacterium]|nr:hypothetical protein [Spirochaetota bacterium]